MAKMHKKVFFKDKIIDKEKANLSIGSSAVLYGLSVYTVFSVTLVGDRKLAFRLKDHYQRLINSSKIIGLDGFEENWSYESFVDITKKLIEKNKVKKDVYVRATVHVNAEIAGTKSRGLPTILSVFIYDAVPILSSEGCRLKTSTWRRIPDYSIPSRAKVNGAYINSVLAKQEAIDAGFDDCVFLDGHGHVCELSAANIFIVRNGKLITPDSTQDLLEGINRDTIIKLSKEHDLTVVERPIDLTELYVADEVFACGTSANVAPVVEIDSRKVGDGKPGKVTRKVQEFHKQARHNQSTHNWLTEV